MAADTSLADRVFIEMWVTARIVEMAGDGANEVWIQVDAYVVSNHVGKANPFVGFDAS